MKEDIKAKKELIQFLKKNKAVATYTWTIYGDTYNMLSVKNALNHIMFETNTREICRWYINLIGKIHNNSNIKDEEYWKRDTLYKLYCLWHKKMRKKFHMP